MKKVEENKLRHHFARSPRIERSDLIQYFEETEGEINKSTFAWRIHDLKKKGILREISRGVYTLEAKPLYEPTIEASLLKVCKILDKNYPNLHYCLWSVDWLNEFTRHQFLHGTFVLETNKDRMDTVAGILGDKRYISVLAGLYEELIGHNKLEPLILMQSLITRAPIRKVEVPNGPAIWIPTLEKLLVDVFAQPDIFGFLGQSEITTIFKMAFKKYAINYTKLFAYAQRRGKYNELVTFVINNFPETSTELGYGQPSLF